MKISNNSCFSNSLLLILRMRHWRKTQVVFLRWKNKKKLSLLRKISWRNLYKTYKDSRRLPFPQDFFGDSIWLCYLHVRFIATCVWYGSSLSTVMSGILDWIKSTFIRLNIRYLEIQVIQQTFLVYRTCKVHTEYCHYSNRLYSVTLCIVTSKRILSYRVATYWFQNARMQSNDSIGGISHDAGTSSNVGIDYHGHQYRRWVQLTHLTQTYSHRGH